MRHRFDDLAFIFESQSGFIKIKKKQISVAQHMFDTNYNYIYTLYTIIYYGMCLSVELQTFHLLHDAGKAATRLLQCIAALGRKQR